VTSGRLDVRPASVSRASQAKAIASTWRGPVTRTSHGLPFFGPHAQWGPRVHFAMAYGGNGITYSMIGAQLLRARIERRRHALESLFGFERL